MTFTDFITKWNGKYIDFDGVYGAQCMDLMHQYCVEVLGITDGSVLAAPSARDVYINFPNVPGASLFEKIDNTPTGVPQEGDIVFWTNTPYGHVAIFHDGDVNSFISFDQNWPTGSPCHLQNHTSYANVGGWLRYKGQQTQQQLIDQLNQTIDQLRKQRDDNWNLYTTATDLLGVGNNIVAVVNEIKKLIADEDALNTTSKDLQTAQTQINDLKTQVSQLQADNTKYQQELQTAEGTVADLQKKVQDSASTISSLSTAITDLQTKLDNCMVNGASGWDLIKKGLALVFGRR